jgi:hypothetical protein
MLRGKVIRASLFNYNADCTVKADHLPSVSHIQLCPEPKAVIHEEALKWPKFEIRKAAFEGNQEKITSLSRTE